VYDVAIVGARCAGSPLATMLARRGLRVCLLDRARFPSETPSTHVIQPCGVEILDELGVLDAVMAHGAVPLDRFTLVYDDVRIDGMVDAPHFPTPGLCVRRMTLDALLVEAAAAAGADVRTGCRVTGLLVDDTGRVTGVQTAEGPVRARVTVGADGRRSVVASSTGAAEYLVTPPGRIPAWGYFTGVTDTEGRLRIGRKGDLAFLASPTDGGLYMAGMAVDVAKARDFHTDRERNFAAGMAEWPELADLLAGAQRQGPIRVMTDWHGYFRRSAGRGWVLVGDAGHFKDFTPAQGISDALRQAKSVTESISTGLDCGGLDAQLRRWWQWRDRDAYAMYWLARDMGVPGASTPLITRIMREVADSDAATRQLLRVLNHELPPAKLFNAARLARAAVGALHDHPRQIRATLGEIAGALKGEIHRRFWAPHLRSSPSWAGSSRRT
jgi:menaquinone-9 beta-reductase